MQEESSRSEMATEAESGGAATVEDLQKLKDLLLSLAKTVENDFRKIERRIGKLEGGGP